MKPFTLSALVASAAGMLGVACASSHVAPPTDQWSAAQREVGRAQAIGAPQVPDAKLHLQLAQEDLQKGNALMGHDNRRAATVLALARTEAQLASSLTEEQQARDEAQRAQYDLGRRGGQ